jgi:hypothetical protein
VPYEIDLAIVHLDAAAPAFELLSGLPAFSGYPDWHPSGDRILFQAGARDPLQLGDMPTDLYTVNPDGSALTRLTNFTPNDPVVWLPTWAPDGSGILVTLTDRTTGAHSLGLIGVDGSALRSLGIGGAHARAIAAAIP